MIIRSRAQPRQPVNGLEMPPKSPLPLPYDLPPSLSCITGMEIDIMKTKAYIKYIKKNAFFCCEITRTSILRRIQLPKELERSYVVTGTCMLASYPNTISPWLPVSITFAFMDHAYLRPRFFSNDLPPPAPPSPSPNFISPGKRLLGQMV